MKCSTIRMHALTVFQSSTKFPCYPMPSIKAYVAFPLFFREMQNPDADNDVFPVYLGNITTSKSQ